jgi:hypothetical protein
MQSCLNGVALGYSAKQIKFCPCRRVFWIPVAFVQERVNFYGLPSNRQRYHSVGDELFGARSDRPIWKIRGYSLAVQLHVKFAIDRG